MGEKSVSSMRFHMALFSIATVLLISSTIHLFRSDDIPIISTSVLKYISSDQAVNSFEPEKESSTLPPPLADNAISLAGTNEPENPQSVNQGLATSESTENKKVCNTKQALLKVYMYDMPPKFHFGLLGWKGKDNEIWPDVGDISQVPRYPGGLNKQHSVDYWLTLDLLASNKENIERPCSAIRVQNVSQADIIFVPFFACLSYNRHSKAQGKKVSLDRVLQKQLVEFLMHRSEWKANGGRDHLIVPHHPNSMMYAREKLASARFVLADFARYSTKVANLEKDVIAPYNHVVRNVDRNSSAPFDQRPILAYFRGAIHRKDEGEIRQKLYNLMKNEKDVRFTSGSLSQRKGARRAGQGMGSSKFCLNIAGDTPSSNRLFDAIVSHCVPVIISDHIELPYEDVLDYSEFSIFVLSSDAAKPGFLVSLLRGIDRNEWTNMWVRLQEVSHHFEYQYPSQPADAVDMTWQAVARKLSTGRYHRLKRKYRRPHGVVEEM